MAYIWIFCCSDRDSTPVSSSSFQVHPQPTVKYQQHPSEMKFQPCSLPSSLSCSPTMIPIFNSITMQQDLLMHSFIFSPWTLSHARFEGTLAFLSIALQEV